MELKVYGHGGKPLVVFPSARGTFYQFEDFGMVEAVRPFIDEGRIRLYTLASNDHETWLADGWINVADRGCNYQAYDAYVVEEAVPFIREHSGYGEKLMVTGCSMGGYHAANFFFRHPDLFDTVIAMSGLYGPWYFLRDYVDDNVYFNFPLLYLPNLTDIGYLERFRQSDIIISVGQGAWEAHHVQETRMLERVLGDLKVPAWVDYWGHDVEHDWPWWRKQLPYFLGTLDL
jgi:esterase/lipase superfamily enzyme